MKVDTQKLTHKPLRSLSLAASLSSALLNIYGAARVLACWRSLKWDFDSEADALRVDAVKLVWGLLLLYFAAAATASTIGFWGIARRKLSSVRFFRDYSIADLVFMFASGLALSYFAFNSSSMLQASVCEELGRQPELMRDLAESGLNLENCEYWFERAVVAGLGVLMVFAVIRVHFVIALSKYYNQLRREKSYGDVSGSSDHALQRIYLLPTPTTSTFPPIHYNHQRPHTTDSSDYYYRDESSEDVLVYAPIPLSSLSVEDAKDVRATEAWISPVPPSRSHSHSHKHHRHHSDSRHHRHKSSASTSSIPYRDDAAEPLTGEKAV